MTKIMMRIGKQNRWINPRLSSICKRLFNNQIFFGNEVISAKSNNMPIVALESTIITHGMPYPDNFNTAMKVEAVVRERGAVPATIGIINGNIHVGLDEHQINKLALEANGPKRAMKCSQRDICSIVVTGANGGTTVGGTVTIAHLAGIPVMATGGIGGVHRGAQETFDISSDLVVLGRTPVAVVCAGVKAILDIPKTLEFLETLGVPVMTVGEAETFPAFYSSKTTDSILSPAKVSGPIEAAMCIKVQRNMGLKSGLIFAVPIPQSSSIDPLEIDNFIRIALEELRDRGISGKDVTPYLLKRVSELTGGKSLASNKVLIVNNARVAADIAVEFSKVSTNDNSVSTTVNSDANEEKNTNVVVVGGAVLDTVLHIEDPVVKFDGRTHKGRNRKSYGGVGRNVAAALVALGINGTRFVTAVGDDGPGKYIIESLEKAGETVRKLPDKMTARYTGIIDNNGECRLGIGEMDIFESIDPNLIRENQSMIEQAQLIILDGNPPVETMREVIDIAYNCHVPVWFEPTDVKKVCKIFQSNPKWDKVLQFVSPNVKELIKMAEYFSIMNISNPWENMEVDEIKKISEKLAEYIPVVFTTMGPEGLLVTRSAAPTDSFYDFAAILKKKQMNSIIHERIQSRTYPTLLKISENSDEQCSVSGCGDCLVAGIVCGMLKGLDEPSCVSLGLEAAAISLQSFETTPSTLRDLKSRTS